MRSLKVSGVSWSIERMSRRSTWEEISRNLKERRSYARREVQKKNWGTVEGQSNEIGIEK